MARWEYFVEAFEVAAIKHFSEVLDELGTDGWELVAVSVLGRNPVYERLYFKRRID